VSSLNIASTPARSVRSVASDEWLRSTRLIEVKMWLKMGTKLEDKSRFGNKSLDWAVVLFCMLRGTFIISQMKVFPRV
jgi:hypothetical protein